MKNSYPLIKKTLIIGIGILVQIPIFAAVPSSPPASSIAPNGGYFARYFQNIIGTGNCVAGSIVTGFDATGWSTYGTRVCTGINPLIATFLTTYLPEIPGKVFAGIDSGGNPVFVDSNWRMNAGNLFYTGGNIGIGTSTPIAKLDVRGGDAMAAWYNRALTLHANHPTMQFKGISDTNRSAFIWYDAQSTSEALRFWVRGTDDNVWNATLAMSISGNGNVGIGTNVPTYKLHVNGDIRSDGWLRTSGDTGWYSESYWGGWHMQDNTWIRGYNGKSLWMWGGLIGGDGGLTVWYGWIWSPGGGAIIAGNVGIGTSAPSAKLDIAGNTDGNIQSILTRSADANFRLEAINRSASNADWAIVSTFGIRYNGVWESSVINFYRWGWATDGKIGLSTNGTNRMYIENNGNVGIGTNTPWAKLDVNGLIHANGNYINVLSYAYNGTPTNGIKIKTNIPFVNSRGMPTIRIEGYEYGGGKTIGLLMNWYVWAGDFYATSNISSYGGYTPIVQLANEGWKIVIYIDDRTYYGRFTVSVYDHGSLGTTPSMFQGWTTADELLTGTNVYTLPYKNAFAGTVKVNGGIEIAGPVVDGALTLNKTSGTNWNYIQWSLWGNRKYWSGLDANGLFTIQSDANTSINLAPLGGNVGIWTATPWAKLDVMGSAKISWDLTVVGKVITDTLVNRTVSQLTVWWSIFPDAASSQKEIGATSNRWANLWLSGNANVAGTVTAGTFVWNGASLTSITAANISAGTAGINITGNAATAPWSGITSKPVYNDKFQAGNWGQHDNHGTYSDFNNINQWGATFIQANNNGPVWNNGYQNYQQYQSLGADYGVATYGMQTAIPRDSTNPYYSVRFRENWTWRPWQKISAGFADNSAQLGGLLPNTSGTNNLPNQIVRTDGSGYANFWYINSSTANGENPGISQVIVTNGDNYYRKSSITNFVSAVQSNASWNWGISITGNAATASTLVNNATVNELFNNWWFRSNGNTGWYSQTYGWWIYMGDATWIRTYGSKNFYHDVGIMRTDGTLQVGWGGSTFNAPNWGNVSIGTSLSVVWSVTAGNMKIVDGTQWVGKVLTSDANGSASWQSPVSSSNNVDCYPDAVYPTFWDKWGCEDDMFSVCQWGRITAIYQGCSVPGQWHNGDFVSYRAWIDNRPPPPPPPSQPPDITCTDGTIVSPVWNGSDWVYPNCGYQGA